MDRRRGLTRVELLVVVGAVVFILFTARWMRNCTSLRVAPPSVLCNVNLKQWGLIFSTYTEDNDGYFFNGEGLADGRWWLDATRHFWQAAPKILQCPNATKPHTQVDRTAFGAWKAGDDLCSYGLNGWVCNPREGKSLLSGSRPATYCWRNTDVEDAGNIPLLLDAISFGGWPRDTDRPPLAENWLGGGSGQIAIEANTSDMNRFSIDRHEGYVNVVFMDFSVRRVGLKELWTLKWHRNYDTSGPWTRAGGVQPMDWPEWMRNFRDF